MKTHALSLLRTTRLLVSQRAQTLLTGPEIENSAFENLEKFFSLKTEDLAIIKARYYLEMKPSITNEELSLLKAHYKVRKSRLMVLH